MIEAIQEDWDAAYFDGVAAVRHAAAIRIRAAGVEVDAGYGTSILWRYDDVELTQGQYPGEPVRLERGDAALIIEDRRFLGVYRKSHYQERDVRQPLSWAQIGGAVIALSIASVGFMVYGSQAVGAVGAALIPPSWESRLGDAVVLTLAPEDERCIDVPKQEAMEKLVARIRSGLSDPRFDYDVTIASGMLNAFAAPGGRIVVFEPLIAMTETPEELAGVLAHEIQHVELRHVTRSLFRQMTVNTVVAAIGGGSTTFEGGALFAQLAHARGDEEAADREGLLALQAANVDAGGMVTMFQKLAERTGVSRDQSNYLSTHPNPSERAETLESMISAEAQSEPILTPQEWRKLRRPCRMRPEPKEEESTDSE